MTNQDYSKNNTDILQNPWRNVYWFSRMLINSDKYGSVGKRSKQLAEIVSSLRQLIDNPDFSDSDKLVISKALIREKIIFYSSRSKSTIDRVLLFCDDLDKKLQELSDVAVFILTADAVMIPINNALPSIPSNDRVYTLTTAKAYLQGSGDKGLASVINLWDDLGVEGCLNAERSAVVGEFAKLRQHTSQMSEADSNLILTAFVQEFERRLGQKRKGRAGGSLEDVTSFIFDYYQIEATHEPDHFQADIEVDKWVKTKDKWLIGISCKRTLRERWKQVSSADRGVLSKYKIKQIWHLITYDEDLSDDKLTLLGNLGHVFYLRDDSRKLIHAAGHIGMKDYVRPMSEFVKDIKQEQSK